MTRRGWLWLAVLIGCVMTVNAAPQRTVVTGTLAYRERIALPPTATIEVTLEDVSRADTASEVVSRLTMPAGGQVPIPFDLPFEAGRVDDAHRYAVRARILEGTRLLFTTTDTVLVLTQGHPVRVSLLLRMAPGVNAASFAPPAATPLPRATQAPVIELRDLPATFTGTLPCADCQGLKYDLVLFPDDAFHLRLTHLGKGSAQTDDVLGSWVLSSDRRVVVLGAEGRPAEYFSIRDNTRLRKLDMSGQEIASKLNYDLRRAPSFAWMDVKGTWKGAYRQGADGRTFAECASGQVWPVADSAAVASLETAYRSMGKKAGDPLVVSVEGRLEPASGQPARLIVERAGGSAAADACAPRFGEAPLDGTTWNLAWLNGSGVAANAGGRTTPSLTFRGDSQTFAGTGGCNRLAGAYQLRGELLSLTAAGTLMACPGADAMETAFRAALTKTRVYRILGHTLELQDDARQPLARFEAASTRR